MGGVSVGEYLVAERASETKHELWAGEVFAMAGASFAHNKIVTNLARELSNALRDRPCAVLPSDMKVFVPAKGGFVYPDLTVVCGEPKFHDEERDVLLNPTLVVEVLSDGTERFDRGKKFAGYRAMPSVRQVVFVSQHERHVDLYTRGARGRWMFDEVADDGVIALEAVGCELALDELYFKVLDTDGPPDAGSA